MQPLTVIHEGHRYVVIDKPAGIAVEKHHNYDTVEARAQVQWGRPRSPKTAYVGIVHRLDRPVSGCLLLAQNKSTLRTLNQAFADRRVDKTYLAMTEAPLPADAGELRHYLLRDKFGRKAVAATRPLPGAKESVLRYRRLPLAGRGWLYTVEPVTGRFHQIRVQLATAGAPIVGDALYGARTPHTEHAIRLHAARLDFPDPLTGKSVSVSCAPAWLPPDQ